MSGDVRGLGHPPERYAAAAEVVTARLYLEYPELLERYGDRGRRFGVHDTTYQIGWIVSAVEQQSASPLRREMVWLRDVLRSRQFPMDVLRRNFELAIEVCLETGLATHDQIKSIVRPVVDELV